MSTCPIGQFTTMSDYFRERMVEALTKGTPLPEVEGVKVELGNQIYGGAGLKVSITDAQGRDLFILLDTDACYGTSYTLSGFRRAFDIKVVG